MLDRRRARRKKQQAIVILTIIGLLTLGVVIAFARGFVRNLRLKQEVTKIQREIQAMELRNAELEKEIMRMQSPEHVERVAREELGLVKPGETLYILSQPLDEDAVQVEKRTNPSTARD